MKTDNNINSFSRARMALLWRFYWPTIKVQLLISVTLVAVGYLLALLSVSMGEPAAGLFAASTFIAALPYYGGPLLFARYSDKTLTVPLPATVNEKFTFAVLYTYVFIPLVMAAVWYALAGLMSTVTDKAFVNSVMINYINSSSDLGFNITLNGTGVFRYVNLAEMLPATVVLCTVFAARRSPVVSGIVAFVICQVSLSMLGGLFGGIYALTQGFDDALAGAEPDPDRIAGTIVKQMLGALYWINIAAVGVSVLGVLYLRRTMRRVQI